MRHLAGVLKRAEVRGKLPIQQLRLRFINSGRII